jgi:hypothetical protein
LLTYPGSDHCSIPDPGSRIRGVKKHRIPDPNPQHCSDLIISGFNKRGFEFINFDPYQDNPLAIKVNAVVTISGSGMERSQNKVFKMPKGNCKVKGTCTSPYARIFFLALEVGQYLHEKIFAWIPKNAK